VTRVKCLLVDDLEENLLVLQALLRRTDVELLTARSGAEALDLLLRHDVALALVDVQMPEMDGFELAELMRSSERTRHVPLIFVTAGARDQYRVFKGYDTGAVDFLFKPIEPLILKNKAEVFFQLHRQKQQIEQELRDRTEMLRLQEVFAGVLGHDLRTPLNAIIASAHVLPKLTTEQAVHDVAARVLSSGHRMNRMIADLLDMTRARLGGGIPVDRRAVTAGDIVGRVVEEQRAASPASSIELDICGDTAGQWDDGRLGQLVSNLVGNAVQHGTAGMPVRVEVDGTHLAMVTIVVANSGVPEPTVLATLFDPFQRGRRASDGHDGLGLGLFIAREIVDAHGGRIEVTIEDPDRTVFRVSLPR